MSLQDQEMNKDHLRVEQNTPTSSRGSGILQKPKQCERCEVDRSLISGCVSAALQTGGPLWMLEVRVGQDRFEALVDTGASRSFVAPSVVHTRWPAEELDKN